MAGKVQSPCPVYRIVHFDNLAGIIEEGGMWCGAEMARRQLPYKQIGLGGLTANRQKKEVPCGPQGSLSDYVPFHFCPRSVMLYQICTGFSDYKGGQEPILHLVTTVEKLRELDVPCVFTDRHAKTDYARFFADPTKLAELDWPAIRSNTFTRTDDDPDRPYRKQAEFLAHRFVPLAAILGVGVFGRRWKDDCDRLIHQAGLNVRVKVHPRWYY
jgi:hypothetical protein